MDGTGTMNGFDVRWGGDAMAMPSLAVVDFGVVLAPGKEVVRRALAGAVADADFPVAEGAWVGSSREFEVGFEGRLSRFLRDRTGLGEGVIRPLTRVVYSDFLDRLRALCGRQPIPLRAGVLETFSELQAEGVPVYLDTPWEAEAVSVILRSAGWALGREYDGLVTGSDVSRGRPGPDLLFEVMRRARVTDPVGVAKLAGDRWDVLAAQACGSGWIGVLSGEDGVTPADGIRGVADLGEFAEGVLDRKLV